MFNRNSIAICSYWGSLLSSHKNSPWEMRHAFNWISTFFRWDQPRLLRFTVQWKSASLRPVFSNEDPNYMKDVLNALCTTYTSQSWRTLWWKRDNSTWILISCYRRISIQCLLKFFLNWFFFIPAIRLRAGWQEFDSRQKLKIFLSSQGSDRPRGSPNILWSKYRGCTRRVKRPELEADH